MKINDKNVNNFISTTQSVVLNILYANKHFIKCIQLDYFDIVNKIAEIEKRNWQNAEFENHWASLALRNHAAPTRFTVLWSDRNLSIYF